MKKLCKTVMLCNSELMLRVTFFMVCEVRNVVMYQEFVILGLRPTNKRTHIQQKGGLNCK